MNPWLKFGLAAAGGTIGLGILFWILLLWVLDAEGAEVDRRNAPLQTDRKRP